jgi:hypothetical protein
MSSYTCYDASVVRCPRVRPSGAERRKAKRAAEASYDDFIVVNSATKICFLVSICNALMEAMQVMECGVFSGFETLFYPVRSVSLIGGVDGLKKCLVLTVMGMGSGRIPIVVTVESLSAGDRSWLARNFPELHLDAAGVPFSKNQKRLMRKYRLALAAGEARG